MCYPNARYTAKNGEVIVGTAHTHYHGMGEHKGADLPRHQILFVPDELTKFIAFDKLYSRADGNLFLGRAVAENQQAPDGAIHRHPPYLADYNGDGCHFVLRKSFREFK